MLASVCDVAVELPLWYRSERGLFEVIFELRPEWQGVSEIWIKSILPNSLACWRDENKVPVVKIQ